MLDSEYRYDVMLSTWSAAPGKRPTFSQITRSLETIDDLLQQNSDNYYDLESCHQGHTELESMQQPSS